MKVERVSLVVHTGKAEAVSMKEDLETFLSERGVKIEDGEPDLVVSLGGDGTMLRAAQQAHAADAPVLGINFGALGYLNEVEGSQATEAFERIFGGELHLEERMMLACEVEGVPYVGLNEVLVERSSRLRMVRIEVSIDGEELAVFNADGVLVATPTGSTAYALSAGGPVVSPKARCLVLVPVNAHILFARPFVLTPEAVATLEVDEASGQAIVSIDGALVAELAPGATVTVRRHPRPLRLVRLSGPGFIQRLRTKLDLPG